MLAELIAYVMIVGGLVLLYTWRRRRGLQPTRSLRSSDVAHALRVEPHPYRSPDKRANGVRRPPAEPPRRLPPPRSWPQ